MACLAPRESHAARACLQGRKRSRAWRWKSPDGSFSRCSRAERMGRRTRKSVAALAGSPPACDPARSRSAGAGIRIKGAQVGGMESGVGAETFRAWDAARRRLPGSRGDWRRRRGGDGGGLPRVAALRSETGRRFPRRLRRICARDRWQRGGSPHGTATVLRDTSVERKR